MGRPARVTREEVLRAAREAFAERGYEGTTLAAIGARIGVSPAALLRHAPTKEALFAAAMAAGQAEETLPMDFLPRTGPAEDPRKVLTRLARAFVPFIERKLGESIARWMRAKTEEEARTFRLPFDPRSRPTPPARGLAMVEDYFRRAKAAGRIEVRNPRAAALAFLGSLHAYVFLHRVLHIADPPIPLDRYIQTLLEIWTHGAIEKRSRGRRSL